MSLRCVVSTGVGHGGDSDGDTAFRELSMSERRECGHCSVCSVTEEHGIRAPSIPYVLYAK